MPDIRRGLERGSLGAVFSGTTWARWGSRLAFVTLMVVLALITVSKQSSFGVVLLAGLLLSAALKIVLPMARIRAGLRGMASGEAGEDAYFETREFVDRKSEWASDRLDDGLGRLRR